MTGLSGLICLKPVFLLTTLLPEPFLAIKPEQFQQCFLSWMASVHQLTQGELVAIDGKTLRGSYNRDDRNSAIRMVSAYAAANKLVLAQLKTDNKSNEITAIPALLRVLDLRGSLVSIDALACQAGIADYR